MSLAELIPLAIQGSIVILVFGLGLEARFSDLTYLLRHPGQFARSMISMYVVMVVLAIVIAELFDIHRAVKIALVALALSPVPPILPRKQKKAGGDAPYTVGLLVTAAVVALVIAPLVVEVIGRLSGDFVHLPISNVLPIVLRTVIVPLAVGMLVRQIWPDVAARLVRPAAILGFVILAAAALPLMVVVWPQLAATVGNGTLIALILFSLVGIAAGHILGGPDPDDRTVLALATAARHPAMALAIAQATYPDEKAVLAVVAWHLIVGALIAVPYVRWRTRTHGTA